MPSTSAFSASGSELTARELLLDGGGGGDALGALGIADRASALNGLTDRRVLRLDRALGQTFLHPGRDLAVGIDIHLGVGGQICQPRQALRIEPRAIDLAQVRVGKKALQFRRGLRLAAFVKGGIDVSDQRLALQQSSGVFLFKFDLIWRCLEQRICAERVIRRIHFLHGLLEFRRVGTALPRQRYCGILLILNDGGDRLLLIDDIVRGGLIGDRVEVLGLQLIGLLHDGLADLAIAVLFGVLGLPCI